MTGTTLQSWVVARVAPGMLSGNYETTARGRALPLVLRNLERQNFEYYHPRCQQRARRRAGRQIKARRVPLFPNYLFIKLNDQWGALRSTYGISGLLFPSGEAEAERLKKNIELLKSQEGDNGLVQLNQRKFKIGQPVRIISGPFEYLEGIVDGMRDRDRVSILMSWLGSVTVAEDTVQAA